MHQLRRLVQAYKNHCCVLSPIIVQYKRFVYDSKPLTSVYHFKSFILLIEIDDACKYPKLLGLIYRYGIINFFKQKVEQSPACDHLISYIPNHQGL